MTDTRQTQIPAAADAVDFEPTDRASFLLKGVLAAGSLYGAAAIGPVVKKAFAQSGGSDGDIEILNFALTLEYLEDAFYRQVLDEVKLNGDLKSLVQTVQGDEAAHVDTLTSTITDLGGKPAKEPEFMFDTPDESAFLKLAVTFEDTGVSAYNGAGPSLTSKELLAAAGSIVQVEGRHAAALRIQNGDSPVIEAFDTPLDEDQVLKAVQPFIKS